MRIELSKEVRGRFLVSWLKLFVPKLPPEFAHFRAVQLTDLHLGPATSLEHLEEAFRIVERLQPHALFLTGDYVQNTRFGFAHALGTRINPKVFGWMSYRRGVRTLAQDLGSLIARIKTTDGVFAVPGNHDYLEGMGSIKRMFPQHIHWLINSRYLIRRGDVVLDVVGVDDYLRGKPNLSAACAQMEAEKPFLHILLSHNPDIALAKDAHMLDSFNLVLCGHTHGGQIRLPLWGAMATRTKQKNHTKGLSHRGKTAFYVNNGGGYGLIGLRLLCPPEILVLELHQE